MTTNALLEQEIPQCLPIIETLCSAGWELDTYLMPRISSTPDADRLALSLQVHRDRQRRSVNYYLDTSGVPLSSRSEGRRDGPGQLYLLCRMNAKKKITWYTVTLTLARGDPLGGHEVRRLADGGPRLDPDRIPPHEIADPERQVRLEGGDRGVLEVESRT